MELSSQPPGTASYSLKLNAQELARYRMMAAGAADHEAAEWSAAGIVPGARIADVGCGPGAVLRLLAERVGAEGQAAGIDADPAAVSIALEQISGLQERYGEFHQARGNDLSVGLRLGDLLADAGLTVERYACRAPVTRIMPGMRPPSWAARDDMVAAGFATEADLKRWEEAFARLDTAERRPWLFPAYTGARRGELLNLRWHDIDLDHSEVRITGSVAVIAGQRIEGTTKSGRSRTVSIDADTVQVLRDHRGHQTRSG